MSVDDDYSSKFPDWWSKWVPKQVENISQAHSYITSNVAGKVPTLYVRYEDLVSHTSCVLTDLFKFVLDVDSLEGTILEHRISEVTSRPEVRSLANTTLPQDFLTDSHREVLGDYMSFFGYNQVMVPVESGFSTQISTDMHL